MDILAGGIELELIDSLEPHPDNPNMGDVGAVMESVEAVGFYSVVYAQRSTRRILAGHTRVESARALGSDVVPVVWLDVDDETATRILIGDNEIPRRTSHPDERKLADLLMSLNQQTPAGLAGTGFDHDDMGRLLANLNRTLVPIAPAEPAPAADAPRLKVRTKPGDLWRLGDHRLICGDCRDPDVVERLLDGAAVNVAFTSPPYADRRKYDETTDFRPIPPDEYVAWFEPVAAHVAEHLAEDGSWFVNIKAGAEGLDTELYVLDLVLAHAREWGWHFATEFCWQRPGVPKQVVQRFKNQFEPVYQFARGRWKMRPEAVQHESSAVPIAGGPGVGDTGWADAQGSGDFFGGRGSAPGLAFPGNRLPTFASTHDAVGHTAAFPVGLPAWFLRAFSDEGDTVLDPFAGSGSTLIAAEQYRRRGFGVEISPAYCDIIVDRWQRTTGGTATRA